MTMGPQFGTPEYREQVDRIVHVGTSVPISDKELNALLMAYILDTSYSRAAICEAEKEIRKRMKS